MTVHVFFAFPETAGKPLEEVEKIFTNGTPAWKTHVSTKRTIAAERGDIEAKTPVRAIGGPGGLKTEAALQSPSSSS